MKISIATRLTLGFIPALLALLIVGWFFFARLNDVAEARQWVTHTLEVLQQLEKARTQLGEAENNATAYALSHNAPFQRKAREAATRSSIALQQVRQLTRDNPAQQARLPKVESALTAYLSELLESSDIPGLPRDPAHTQGEPVRQALSEIAQTEQALLDERRANQAVILEHSSQSVVAITGAAIVLVILIGIVTIRRITQPLLRLEAGARRVGEGDYEHRIDSHEHDEIGRVAAVFNQMVGKIQQREIAINQQSWIKSNLAGFMPIFQSGQDLKQVSQTALEKLAELLQVPVLVLYIRDDSQARPGLSRCASVAAEHAPAFIPAGEGLSGRCLIEGRPIQIAPQPDHYLQVKSALGSSPPRQLLVNPVAVDAQVKAVLEMALMAPLTEVQQEFLNRFCIDLGLVIDMLQARQATESALKTQTALAHTLEQQRGELAQNNQELAQQTMQLQASERLAREQQEELRLANQEQQQANTELRALTQTLDLKAQQLAETSAFKSEFLANMSHELRTPLNSLLILSKLLAEDADAPLSVKQQQYARTIHEAGNDLLTQINEILDMARVESGQVRIDVRDMPFAELARKAEDTFRQVAQSRQLNFEIDLAPSLGESVPTDANRVWQIVKNLLSNAFKFTAQGGVRLKITPMTGSNGVTPGVALSVKDSGIGIPEDKQALVFEAFKQADSGIARQYGGTGLGLSISLKLAQLLGGTVSLHSDVGLGSEFTLWLPLAGPSDEVDAPLAPSATIHVLAPPAASPSSLAAKAPAHAVPASPDAVLNAFVISTSEPALLNMLGALARQRGMTLVHVPDATQLVATCIKHQPALAVLDVRADTSVQWTAMGHLKQDARTRHIGIHVLCNPEQKPRAMRLGAASCTLLPLLAEAELTEVVGRRLERLMQPKRNVMVIEDDAKQQAAILALIGNGDIHAIGVATGTEALDLLSKGNRMDCVVLDLGLPDMDGSALLDQLNDKLGPQAPPVIVYTARMLSSDEELSLMRRSHALIVKGAHSPERLIDELTLLLSRPASRLSAQTKALIDKSRQHDPVLAGRTLLVVDDDVRNIFAISAALETYGAQVIHAENGLDGIQALQDNPETALVLMDVMMPTLDGLETTRRIRKLPGLDKLPIIAVTAKAMPGDRESCIAAGASDYLSKPVDMDHLRAMIRVWLSQSPP